MEAVASLYRTTVWERSRQRLWAGLLVAAMIVSGLALWASPAAAATISFVGASQGQTTGSTLTINKPGGLQAGDLMLAAIAIEGGTDTAATITPPTATGTWTLIGRVNRASDIGLATYRKVATADDVGAASYGWGVGKKATGGITAFRGVDPFNPIDVRSVNANTNSSMVATGVTTTVDNGHLVAFYGTKNSGSLDHTPPVGMTRRIMTSLNDGFNTSGHQQGLGSAGATGNRSSESRKTDASAESTPYAAQLIALRPAATVTVTKVLDPDDDEGLFDLRINGTTRKADAGHQDSTGAVTVPTGSVTVDELAGTDTDLDDYDSKVECDTGKGSTDPGTSHTFTIESGEDVTCTITNERKITAVPVEIERQSFATGMTSPNSGNASRTLTIAKPSGVEEGDFLLAQITFEKGSDAGIDAQITPNNGWTLERRTNRGSDLGQAIFWKVAGDQEPASYSFPFRQDVKAAGGIISYTGVAAASPIVASSGGSGDTSTLRAPGVTAVDDSMLVSLFGFKKKDTTLSVPNGMNGIYNFQNPQDVTIRAADEKRDAGATGDRESRPSPSNSDKWVGQNVVLRPQS